MEQEDIKAMNKVAESSRKNAKVMDRLINKFKKAERLNSKEYKEVKNE